MSEKKKKIGIAYEASYCKEKPDFSNIIYLTGIDQQIPIKGEEVIIMDMNAEFDCPCCDKKIRIKIRKKIKN